ncbi:MAG TPA: hypothetical protein VFY45_15090 [Baekduia sp.]|nr:hypothetical protein [Baekduia sp.]
MAISASRRGVVRGGVMPAALLVLGLAAVAGSVLGSAGVSSTSVHKYRSDWGVYTVGHYPSNWSFPLTNQHYSSIVSGHLQVATIVLLIVYLSAATAVGSFVVDGLRGDDRWPRAVSVLAGFIPGYLMLLLPLQLLFATVPYQVAPWIALLGVPAVAIVLHRRVLVETGRALRHELVARRRIATTTAVVIGVVGVAAVHRLQAGNYFLIPDSPLWWLQAAQDQVQGGHGRYLVQWNQQTDEWIFGAPLLLRSYSVRTGFTSLYAMQALGLASFACLVFGIVHRLASRRQVLAACVAVGVVLASTPLIYPWRYITIIGGDNPVLWTGQTGRQIGIVAPWAALLLIGRQGRATAIATGFATAGLAFTSVQNVIYVVIAVGAGVAWRSRAGNGSAWMRWPNLQGAALLLPVAALAMIVGAFWWLGQAWAPTDAVWWLLASVVLAVAGAVAIGLGTAGRDAVGPARGSPGWIGAWMAALAGGFMLSNNAIEAVFGDDLRHLLGFVFPGYGEALAARQDLGGDIFGGFAFPTFSPVACKYFNYCASFDGFLASFGFMFVVVLATWLALGRMTTEAAVNARRVALLLMIAAIAATFIIMFFTGAEIGIRPNVLSRLLDVPYYGLLGLAAMTFASSRDRVTTLVGTGVLAVWTVVPLIGSQWPEQMVTNGIWLVRHTGLL